MSVRFEEVSKRFGDVVALSDFSLDIDDGEFMVLLGPSGCGKTTALRILAGLEEATAGGVYIDGRDVTDVPAHKRDIAMVFQSYALYPHMKVYDNIAFGLRMRHMPKAEVDRSVRAAAEQLGLTSMLKRRPGELSGGQRQRVALARAIVRRPKAFLMDEPLSNLDAKLRAQTRIELIHLHRQLQTTVLYVTHDQVEAMTMGRRIAVMDGGRLQQVGTPLDIYDRPANLFVAEFIGSPPMSFFRGRLESNTAGGACVRSAGIEFALTPGQARPAGAAGEVVVGVRPEHIRLAAQYGERPAAAAFEATVDVVEMLGNETHATLLLDAASMIARLPADEGLTPGTKARFVVAPEHLHLFDGATGRRLE